MYVKHTFCDQIIDNDAKHFFVCNVHAINPKPIRFNIFLLNIHKQPVVRVTLATLCFQQQPALTKCHLI